MRFASCRRTAVLLSAFALVSLAGCFRSPNMTKLSCTTNAHCPSGYQCVVAAGQPAGICEKPVDAGEPDIVAPIDVPIGIDVTLPVDHASVVDIAGSTIDSPATSDVPAVLDTIGPLDTTPDSPTSPDLGADLAPDVPGQPDTALDLGADLAPDVPAQPDTALDSLPSCPVNLPQNCNGTCIAQNTACNGTCPTGQRTCPGGNTCIGIAAPACCSASECTTTAAHTISTCTNNTCVTTCAPSYSSCSSGCVDLTSDNSNCGTCGTPCTGGRTCTSSTCQCPAGQGLCGGTTCVDITAAAHCSADGITCNSCSGTATPWCVSGTCAQCRAGGSDCTGGRTCSNGTCSCPAGTTDCGSSGCINVNGSDGTHCGSCTNVCASNQNCSAGSCQCTLGALVCGGCLGWDFESGTQYWVKDTNPVEGFSTSNGAGTPTTSTSIVVSGSSQSLQVPINIDMNTVHNASVAVPICQSGGTTDLYNHTLSLKVFFDGATPFNVLTLLRAYAWSGAADINCSLMWGTQMTTGSWLDASCQFTTSGVQTNHIAITILNSGDPWAGTMYLDNVMIQ